MQKNFSDMDNEELLQFQITYLTQLQFEIYPNMIPTKVVLMYYYLLGIMVMVMIILKRS